MPTYEYECRVCAHRFEVFQSMSDAPLRVCPVCGKDLRRLIDGGSGIIFKGSGFYVNDSKKMSATAVQPGRQAAQDKKAQDDKAQDNKAPQAGPSGAAAAASGAVSAAVSAKAAAHGSAASGTSGLPLNTRASE